MASPTSLYRRPGFYGLPLALLAILGAIGWAGLGATPRGRFTRPDAWLLIFVLMSAFAVLAGRGITGHWRGLLIDNRFKISLARLQLLVWWFVVLSAFLAASLTNEAFGSRTPLAIQIPQELWILLGISTVSGVASPVLIAPKKEKRADGPELERTIAELQKDDRIEIDRRHASVIIENTRPEHARWSDLLKGDESGNAATVDVGKLQMFFITFVLALGYCVAIHRLFEASGSIASLPAVDSTVNTLLGISHTGYLANKAVPHSRESPPPVP